MSDDARPIGIELAGAREASSRVRLIELSGQPGDVNSFQEPRKVYPKERTFNASADKFQVDIAPFTVAVLRIGAERAIAASEMRPRH